MAKTRADRKAERELSRYERQLVEVDGEFCIPQEEGQARHLIDTDLGPIFGEVRQPRSYFIKKILLFIPAIFLFILAIQLMKEGAAAVGPSIEGQFPFPSGLSTLGAGWLGAYFVLSGSPVAATAISLFGAGTIDKPQTLTMLSGSRLGASFIFLVTGFLYTVKNKGERTEGLSIGIQAMTMTAIQYIPGMLLAYAILRAGWLDGMNLHASDKLDAFFAKLWGPIVDLASNNLPGWALFLVGLATILAKRCCSDPIRCCLTRKIWMTSSGTSSGFCIKAPVRSTAAGRIGRSSITLRCSGGCALSGRRVLCCGFPNFSRTSCRAGC